ncbi:MAG: hypothetical protein LUQ31_09170 [Methanoregula sp.]|nr:hypothetical protein [Methanoregula sp.]
MKSTKKSNQSPYAGHIRQERGIEPSITALLSERSLAKDWLKPEEESAWNYL